MPARRILALVALAAAFGGCTYGATVRHARRIGGGGRTVGGVHAGFGLVAAPPPGEPNGARFGFLPELELAGGSEDGAMVGEAGFSLPAYKYFGEDWGVEGMLWMKSVYGGGHQIRFGPELELGVLRVVQRSEDRIRYGSLGFTIHRSFMNDPGWFVGLAAGFDQVDVRPRRLE